MMAALILIAIVAFAGIMLFFMTSSFFKGGGKASITLSATGSGSSNGQTATIQLVIQNSGDGAANITGVYVEAESQGANPTSVSPLGANVDTGTSVPANPPTSGGFTVDARANKNLLLKVQGSGLYAGAQLHVYVTYVDLGSGETGVADAVVVLR
jgi:hypothetical protein